MLALLLRHWLAVTLLVSAAMLAVAHGFELFGYTPCTLCFRQREVYWAALALAAGGLGAQWLWRRRMLTQVATIVLGLVFLIGAVVAAYHAGVEWKFWPGPATCAAGGVQGSILDALSRPLHVARCDEAAWRMLGLSMAGYNALISLVLAGLSFAAAGAVRGREDNARGD